jgi:hypothetical protein
MDNKSILWQQTFTNVCDIQMYIICLGVMWKNYVLLTYFGVVYNM